MEKRERKVPDTKFLEWGFKAAIIIAFFGILCSTIYLFYFMFKSNVEVLKQDTITGFSAERRMCLLSTGIFVAMAFGFLGFALFLLQIKGEVEAQFEYNDYKINITKMSPGLFVILCSTVIIIVCATFRIEYKIPEPSSSADTENATKIAPYKDDLGIDTGLMRRLEEGERKAD